MVVFDCNVVPERKINKNPILPQKRFSSVKSFQLWLFLFCFDTGVVSDLDVPVILQIIGK